MNVDGPVAWVTISALREFPLRNATQSPGQPVTGAWDGASRSVILCVVRLDAPLPRDCLKPQFIAKLPVAIGRLWPGLPVRLHAGEPTLARK